MTGFEPAASTSQTSRATNCATPRKVKNIEFLRFFRKWSNMWSNRFYRGFCERAECRKSQCLQGLFFNVCKDFRGFAFQREALFCPRGRPRRCPASKLGAIPVVTKPLSSLLRNSPIGKSLPLLFPRFIRHCRRSETSPAAPHLVVKFYRIIYIARAHARSLL